MSMHSRRDIFGVVPASKGYISTYSRDNPTLMRSSYSQTKLILENDTFIR